MTIAKLLGYAVRSNVIMTESRSSASAQIELRPYCIGRYKASVRDSSAEETEDSIPYRPHRSSSGSKRQMDRTIPGEFVDTSTILAPDILDWICLFGSDQDPRSPKSFQMASQLGDRIFQK
jgi:hypothetical protein